MYIELKWHFLNYTLHIFTPSVYRCNTRITRKICDVNKEKFKTDDFRSFYCLLKGRREACVSYEESLIIGVKEGKMERKVNATERNFRIIKLILPRSVATFRLSVASHFRYTYYKLKGAVTT